MMEFYNIILEKKDHVAKIILNRAEFLNAIDTKTVVEISSAIDEVSQDDEVKVLVLTGVGRAFSSGGDIKAMSERHSLMQNYDSIKKYNKVISKMANLERVTISKVNGIAIGAGLSLALTADIAIASEKARFSAPFLSVGLVPDMGLHYSLVRTLGLTKAKELVFTHAMIDAAQAEKIGLVNKVVPESELDKTVDEMVQTMTALPPRALAMSKAIFNKVANVDLLFKTLSDEAYIQTLLMQTEDHLEGIQAFLGKREPKFTGK